MQKHPGQARFKKKKNSSKINVLNAQNKCTKEI